MLEFIKMFGLGILYTILFPFIIAIFVLHVVYAFCNYLVLEFISIFGFFFGYTFSEKTPLEKKLESIKVKPVAEEVHVAPVNEFDDFFSQTNVTSDLKGSDEYE